MFLLGPIPLRIFPDTALTQAPIVTQLKGCNGLLLSPHAHTQAPVIYSLRALSSVSWHSVSANVIWIFRGTQCPTVKHNLNNSFKERGIIATLWTPKNPEMGAVKTLLGVVNGNAVMTGYRARPVLGAQCPWLLEEANMSGLLGRHHHFRVQDFLRKCEFSI